MIVAISRSSLWNGSARRPWTLAKLIAPFWMATILLSVYANGLPAPGACQNGAFQCKGAARAGPPSCVPKQHVCDSTCNCQGCEDENVTMCVNRTCSIAEFHCGGGQCIDLPWHCDGQQDCTNGADESTDCGKCPDGQYRCQDGARCIEPNWVCDGEADCTDASDEQSCSSRPPPIVTSCAANKFWCDDRSQCLVMRWVCDGEKDCTDGSDETPKVCNRQPASTTAAAIAAIAAAVPASSSSNSGSAAAGHSADRSGLRCTAHEFACTSGRCIPLIFRCDSSNDCGDNSDETNCTCPTGAFACSIRHQCIPSRFRCSGQRECEDGTDELGCSMSPSLQQTRAVTTQPGVMAITGTATPSTAPPVDRCSRSGCEHKCLASGTCACNVGYVLHANGVNCTDVDECAAGLEQPGFCSQLCTNTLGAYRCSCVEGYVVSHSDNRSCKAVGDRPHVVFANRVDIRQLRLGVPDEYSVVVSKGRSILALDIDEANRIVYYSDAHEETIYRANLPTAIVNSSDVQPLVQDGVRTVDGIAYDWIYERLYWTDAVTKEVSAMETTHLQRRAVLISGLSEPRAIALHPSRGLMFFSDWGSHAIYRAGMDGRGLLAIVTNDIVWPNGLALDHATENLYWIDAHLKCIRMANLDGRNQRVLVDDPRVISNPFAISVFEDSVYWSERSNMAIMTAHKLTGANVTRLLVDAVNNGEPLDVKVQHAARQPLGVNHCLSSTCEQLCFPAPRWPAGADSAKPPVSCRCMLGYSLDANGRTCSAVPTPMPLEQEQSTAAAAAATSDQLIGKGGVIAGITLAVLVVLAVAVAGFVVFLRRHCVNDRTVNFDNPVYMKTTEDRLDLKCNEQRPSVTTPAVLQPLNTAEAQAATDDVDA